MSAVFEWFVVLFFGANLLPCRYGCCLFCMAHFSNTFFSFGKPNFSMMFVRCPSMVFSDRKSSSAICLVVFCWVMSSTIFRSENVSLDNSSFSFILLVTRSLFSDSLVY